MATILGKSAVRTIEVGKVPKRDNGDDGKDRIMEVLKDGDRVYIHLHSPGNLDNGWAITVSLKDVLAAI